MGDYDPAIHATGYLSELRFVADQSPDLEQKIQLHHVTLKWVNPVGARDSRVNTLKWLHMRVCVCVEKQHLKV